jgi:hypothetical protein
MKTTIHLWSFHSVLLRMKNISNSYWKNQNTHSTFIHFLNGAIYGTMWKNIAELDKPKMTTWHMLITRWIPKATNTYSEYVILFAWPLQKWLHQCVSTLHYTSIGCPVHTNYTKLSYSKNTWKHDMTVPYITTLPVVQTEYFLLMVM